MRYDCIIVGAGPAGIFSALELARGGKGLKILLVEKGRDLEKRERKDLFSGFGGAGAFSDGKLNLTKDVGGFLRDYLEDDDLDDLIGYSDGLFLEFGATEELKGQDKKTAAGIEETAARAGLRLVTFPIRHMGTDRCFKVLKNMREALGGGVDLLFDTEVKEIVRGGGVVKGVRTADGAEYGADYVILCPGRSGSHWLQDTAEEMGLTTTVNPVDIGVRVEVPASILRSTTDTLHEAKLLYNSKKFDDQVRTFCMNPYGIVVKESHAGFCTVNGHSFSKRGSENTNFAILVSTTFTEPFHEPIAYGRYIARLANLLGEGIIVQRLGDLLHGRRSTPGRIKRGGVRPTLQGATPGDLSFVLPYRYVSDIIEMLEVLDRFAPGVNSPSTLLYGIEVKFYSLRLKLAGSMETEIKNLFAAGDGAGVTRGIIQAAVSGVVAAREILKRTLS